MKATLATKHSLLIGAAVAIATVGMATFVVRDATQAKRHALMRHGAEIAEIVAEQAPKAIYARDRARLDVSLAGLTAAPVIAYARILDAQVAEDRADQGVGRLLDDE